MYNMYMYKHLDTFVRCMLSPPRTERVASGTTAESFSQKGVVELDQHGEVRYNHSAPSIMQSFSSQHQEMPTITEGEGEGGEYCTVCTGELL